MSRFPLPLTELFIFAVVLVLALNELRLLRKDERRDADGARSQEETGKEGKPPPP